MVVPLVLGCSYSYSVQSDSPLITVCTGSIREQKLALAWVRCQGPSDLQINFSIISKPLVVLPSRWPMHIVRVALRARGSKSGGSPEFLGPSCASHAKGLQ